MNRVIQIANITKYIYRKPPRRDNPNQYRLYDTEGISPAIGTMQGGGRQPYIIVNESRDYNSRQVVTNK